MAAHPSGVNQHGLGISRISVTGFKSLATKTDLEIRPLTVLAGANSSGKSSFMQPLLLMKQTLESDVNPAGPFLLSGPYTRYTETEQFLSHVGASKNDGRPLSVEFTFDEGLTAGMAYSAEPGAGLHVAESWGSNSANQLKWKIARSSPPEELRAMLLGFSSIPLLMKQMGFTVLSVQEYQFYQCLLYSMPVGPGPSGSAWEQRELYFMQENLTLNSHIRRLIYVPGLRGDQDRKWLLAEVTEQGFFEGPFESYVPSLILSWQLPGNLPKVYKLVNALGRLDLASGISPIRLNESELEIRVPRTRDSTDDDFVNVADVGLAVSTVLPVLVALIQADPGQLVYIEQPELHLHPRAQLKLAELLAEAANRGVRLVIETHSSLLLQGILTCVAKSSISPDRVALHWFSRNEEGVTNVATASIDNEGRVGDWPSDFDNVELEASNDYLDSAEAKLIASKGI